MSNEQILERLNQIATKLSMQDSQIRIFNSVFYLPNYPKDVIQRLIVDGKQYWDLHTLYTLDNYMPEDAVICDIGANIGSHSLYWAVERGAKKVYAFEPIKETFEILKKNVKLNRLENIVIPYNCGLYNKKAKAIIDKYTLDNIGGTSIKEFQGGYISLKRLDDFDIPEKVDVLKINVEGMELEVLEGAFNIIQRDKPIILLTSFNRQSECVQFMLRVGYRKDEVIRNNENAIYIPHKSLFTSERNVYEAD